MAQIKLFAIANLLGEEGLQMDVKEMAESLGYVYHLSERAPKSNHSFMWAAFGNH